MSFPPAIPPPFNATVLDEGGVVRVVLQGELDLATAPEAERVLDEAIDGRDGTFVLDLSGMTFVDSSGLRVIIGVHTRCNGDGCNLSLIPGPRGVQRVFDVAGVLPHLPFVFDRTDAEGV